MICSWGEFHLTDKEVVLAVLYVILEWWLGRTRKTQAASTLDLVALGFVAMAVFIGSLIKRKKDDGK